MMQRLAIYAHYSPSPQVAGYVLYCLKHLAAFGFQVCFVSNSELSPASMPGLKSVCDRIMVRDNAGFDFCMWQSGLAQYDQSHFDELLLINSSIIGPLQPLESIWQNPALDGCDFWGLTDNSEFKPHLSSYFLVFRKPVLQSRSFADFWRTVLPYKNKPQVIFSYELGLTEWLKDAGFQWRAVFPQQEIDEEYRAHRGLWKKSQEQLFVLKHLYRNRELLVRNTPLVYPDILLEHGMPFLKVSLLHQNTLRSTPAQALDLLAKYGLPAELIQELRH
jgi:rhamnosyltransferase